MSAMSSARFAAAVEFNGFTDEELDQITEQLLIGNTQAAQRMTFREMMLAVGVGLQTIKEERERLKRAVEHRADGVRHRLQSRDGGGHGPSNSTRG